MRSDRWRDLLLTLVLVCIGLTPAWLMPQPWSRVWQGAVLILVAPAIVLSWSHAPWQPTPQAEFERLVAHLGLKAGQRFCDLGAGDGRLVAYVRRVTGAQAWGIEASPLLWLLAQVRLWGRRGASVHWGDLYRADLSDVDVAYVWGTAYSVSATRFGARMKAALRPGARLVSYHYPVHGLTPEGVDHGGERPLYVYVMPDRS